LIRDIAPSGLYLCSPPVARAAIRGERLGLQVAVAFVSAPILLPVRGGQHEREGFAEAGLAVVRGLAIRG
jgi:hypothetical protein